VIDDSIRPVLVAAAYVLAGIVVVATLLPGDGWTARRLARPYGRLLGGGLRAVAGISALPTVFFIECAMNGGRMPPGGWTAELLGWPYRALLWPAFVLVVSVVAWPLVLIEEWGAWLVRHAGPRRPPSSSNGRG